MIEESNRVFVIAWSNAVSDSVEKIHEILSEVRISPEMIRRAAETGNDEHIQTALWRLRLSLQANRPKSLFKIKRAGDHSIEDFERDRLVLSRADEFNDPFECMLYFDRDKLVNKIRGTLTEEGLRDSFERQKDLFPESKKFATAESFIEHALKMREVFLDDIALSFSDVVKALQERTYIASLSENLDSSVMWGTYGDSHKGFAMEYEFEDKQFCPHLGEIEGETTDIFGWLSLLPVMYSEERASGIELAEQYSFQSILARVHKRPMPMHYPSFVDLLLYTKLSLRKPCEWSYENEWRLVMTPQPREQNDGKRAYMHICPKAIYLGARSGERVVQRERLIGIARDKGLPVYEMYLEHGMKEYKMSCRQLY